MTSLCFSEMKHTQLLCSHSILHWHKSQNWPQLLGAGLNLAQLHAAGGNGQSHTGTVLSYILLHLNIQYYLISLQYRRSNSKITFLPIFSVLLVHLQFTLMKGLYKWCNRSQPQLDSVTSSVGYYNRVTTKLSGEAIESFEGCSCQVATRY